MEKNNFSKNYKIIFTKDKYPILAEIIKRYKLEALDEKSFKALLDTKGGAPLQEAPSPSITILNAVNNIVAGSLLIKNAPELLKKTLNLSDKDASSLADDVRDKLVAICKKVSREEPVELPKNGMLNGDEGTEKTIGKIAVPETSNKKEVSTNKLPQTAGMEETKKPMNAEPDKYRESIG